MFGNLRLLTSMSRSRRHFVLYQNVDNAMKDKGRRLSTRSLADLRNRIESIIGNCRSFFGLNALLSFRRKCWRDKPMNTGLIRDPPVRWRPCSTVAFVLMYREFRVRGSSVFVLWWNGWCACGCKDGRMNCWIRWMIGWMKMNIAGCVDTWVGFTPVRCRTKAIVVATISKLLLYCSADALERVFCWSAEIFGVH